MNDLAQQRVRKATHDVGRAVSAQVEHMFASARIQSSAEQIDTLWKVELAKMGVPISADLTDAVFMLGFVVGRIVNRGATMIQVMEFLDDVANTESRIEDEILLPNATMKEQLKWSRMLNAQIWEIYYAIDDELPNTGEGDQSDDRFEIAVRTAEFAVQYQMLVLRSQ